MAWVMALTGWVGAVGTLEGGWSGGGGRALGEVCLWREPRRWAQTREIRRSIENGWRQTCGISRIPSRSRRQEFGQTTHVGAVYIHRQHHHTVALKVLDQDAWVVEAHRLVVEQAAAELDGVIELEPRRLI